MSATSLERLDEVTVNIRPHTDLESIPRHEIHVGAKIVVEGSA